jgi:ribokinase
MPRVAVVGHVEWVQFLRVERLPVAGEIQRAQREGTRAGGGAVVAAAVLAENGAEVDFYLAEANAVYVTAGDPGALKRARAARVLVATPRLRERLERPGVYIDALVFSASDEVEAGWARRLESDSRLMVATEGPDGGRWWGESEGRWAAVAPPGPIQDSYGCGDTFAAGFTYGLGAGEPIGQACEIGARWGAEMLTRVGAP